MSTPKFDLRQAIETPAFRRRPRDVGDSVGDLPLHVRWGQNDFWPGWGDGLTRPRRQVPSFRQSRFLRRPRIIPRRPRQRGRRSCRGFAAASRDSLTGGCWIDFHQDATMGAAGKFRVLDFSALDADAEPVRVRPVENDDVSMPFLPFKASDHQPLELVPDLSAGTSGSAIPVAGSAPRPAARYRGGSVLPAEAPPMGNATPLPPMAAPAPVRRKCGTRARAPRGRTFRRRGSRRGAVATRAGPDDSSGDPEHGPSSGHVGRDAGWPA
jgi:hypothetical protein